jgi:carbonic anhydrase/acetyltransferase-like protein (isoleucine patch superfamily)
MKLESGNSADIITFRGYTPKLHPSVFTCAGVRIVGDVEIDEYSSVWFNSVIRGDVHHIRIGKRSNIQDMCMLHVTNNRYPLIIGDDVSLAHSVTVHGCTIKNNVLVGMGALVLDNAVVNSNSIVAAATVVKENFVVPEGVLIAGVPGKIIRDLNEQEIARISNTAPNYINYANEYREEYRKYQESLELN